MKQLSRQIKNLFINRRLLMFLLLPFVVFGLYKIYEQKKVNEIYAVDPLVVTYDGNAPPDPVFSITNMLPGDTEEKTFNVKNDSPDPTDVEMFGTKTEEEKNFAQILDVEVTQLPSTVIYTGKLQGFFDAGVFSLGNFPAGTDKSYKVKVYFPWESGNEYQLAKVVFDITWRTKLPDELPPECEPLRYKITSVIRGTEGNDNIHGNIQSNLILAYGGNDTVDASSNDDCVVLGDGDDYVESESGNDIVLGGNGNDKIYSGFGNDTVYGGEGDDTIYLGSGVDKAWGGNGNDFIDGGSSADEIHGGTGNDTLLGGSGNDKIYGEEDDDNLKGGTENDYLDGGSGTDTINGNSGTDTCVAGETNTSCEH